MLQKENDLLKESILLAEHINRLYKFTVEIAFNIHCNTHKPEIVSNPNASLNGMKVLLAEDNDINMEIAKIILEDEGIDVTTAENGQFAAKLPPFLL